MTKLEQLERHVTVLREGIREAMGRHFEGEGVQSDRAWDDLDDALATADRIAAEPVEETDRDAVESWSKATRSSVVLHRSAFGGSVWVSLHSADGSANFDGDEVSDCDTDGADLAYAAAAAWVRAQGVGNG